MKNENKSIYKSISWKFIRISYLPMILLTIIVTLAGSSFVSNSLKAEAGEGMVDLTKTINMSLDKIYPGDYKIVEDSGDIYMFKGEHQINGDYELLDEIKENTGCDVTICYLNYAVATTLKDKDGVRLVGAGDSQRVVDEVINADSPKYYSDVTFNKDNYLAYYYPLHDSDDEVIGMLVIAKDSQILTSLVWKAILPIVCISLAAMFLACFFAYSYSKNFIYDIKRIQKYMGKVADGYFDTQLDVHVDQRDDELGQMAYSAVRTAGRLRKMVEEDQLTQIYNRRSADKKIKATLENYISKGVVFCLAIGDIDFFKKINDTYGHEAGDDVLIEVAGTLKKFMSDKGYAIRWGGEEFLLIFEKGNVSLDACSAMIEELLDKIRALEIVNNENHIKINMTFGLVECEEEDKTIDLNNIVSEEDKNPKDTLLKEKMDHYISKADLRLYYGKEHGRNQLVNYPVD